MTVKNTDLGGTDWSDGEVLYAVDLNDTFDDVAGRLFRIDSGAEDTGTYNGNFGNVVTLRTFTFTPTNSNNILLGIKMILDIISITSGGDPTSWYWIDITDNNGNNIVSQWISTDATGETDAEIYLNLGIDTDSFATNSSATVNGGGAFAQSSYVITLKTIGGANTSGRATNITPSFFYIEDGIITTSSAKVVAS